MNIPRLAWNLVVLGMLGCNSQLLPSPDGAPGGHDAGDSGVSPPPDVVEPPAPTPIDVTLLLDITGTNARLDDSTGILQRQLVAPLLSLSNLHVGVSYAGDFGRQPYGDLMDEPFIGGVEPNTAATAIDAAMRMTTRGGGDNPEGMIEGLAVLSGRPIHPMITRPLACSTGRVPGGCWRSGAQRVIVLFTDGIFHNGPDPDADGLLFPYVGIAPAPATWPEVQSALRASNTLLLVMSTLDPERNAARPMAQYREMLSDLGQPMTDIHPASTPSLVGSASDAVVARIRALRAM